MLLFMESFDGYGGTSTHMTKYFSQPSLEAGGRTGPYRVGNGSVGRNIAPTGNTLIIGFALHHTAGNSSYFTIYEGLSAGAGSEQTALSALSDGRVQVHTGSYGSAVLDVTAAPVLVSGSWNFIEWKTSIANAGTYAVKVNGALVLSGTGDTQARSTPTIGSVHLWALYQSMDDVYVLDGSGTALNDFIGDCKIECLTPQAGNGSNTGLTCSTGTDHGAMVDELPANDDTDYNYGTTAGVKDTYNFTNVTTVGVVKAVQTSIRAKKTDSATKELAIVTRLGGVDYDSATHTVASIAYGQYQQLLEKRPTDNTDWLIADVNAAEFGMKVVL
jgi:hypothetical protein